MIGKVKALIAADRGDEAKALAEETLSGLAAPESDLDIRTHRYRKQLKDLVDPPAETARD